MSGDRSRRRANITGGDAPREVAVSPGRADDDAALFREATRDVKPLAHEREVLPGKRPSARARFTRADREAILEESLQPPPDDPALVGGDELAFTRPGVRQDVLRRLRRGHYRVQAELDLHGLTVREAKAILREFLVEALRRGAHCVRIIHGKGLRSGPRGPVLKQAVAVTLRRSGHVIAYASARAVDGGTGAVYALLSTD